MQLDNILSRLDKAHKAGKDTYRACCPAHNGTNKTTLVIKDAGDRILIDCKAGCDTKSVLDAIQLRWSDLFADSLTPRQNAQHQVDALSRKIQEYDTLLAIYEHDMRQGKMTDSTKSRYRDLIASRIDCMNHKQNLQNKYGIN